MYGQKMFAQDRVSPNYDLFGDGDLQLLQCPPSQLYAQQQQQQQQPQPWSSADNLGPAKSSNTMLSRFKSPTSAFYAVEELMGFSQDRCQVSSTHQNGCLNADFPAATKTLPQRQNMLPVDDAAFAWKRVADKTQEYKVSSNPYSYHVPQLSFSNSQQEKQSPKFSSSATFGPVLPNKTRIRWTPDLHEKFVACVNSLGGADKATPKAILKLMGSDGLTIFHIKSHLQKYRIAKYIPESAEGRSDRRTSMNDVTRLNVKNGLQIKEALQLQLDVQRRLHEQLEIQRNLQLRIEEQGRQLKMMFNQQQQQSTKALLINNNQDEKSVEDDDIFSMIDGSDNSYFNSKIS